MIKKKLLYASIAVKYGVSATYVEQIAKGDRRHVSVKASKIWRTLRRAESQIRRFEAEMRQSMVQEAGA